MVAWVVHAITTIIVRLWLSLSADSWRRLPRPIDEPTVRIDGPEGDDHHPDQLLVAGSGAVVGYGVLSYRLSLSGELARMVAEQTGRGVVLDLVVGPDLSLARCRRELSELPIGGYDAVLLSVGSVDALLLLPIHRWRRDLGRLLDLVQSQCSPRMPVVLQAIPPLLALVQLPWPYRTAIDNRYRAFNAISQELAAQREHVTFLRFDPPAIDLIANAGRQVHIVWAALLAPAVSAALGGRHGAP